MAALSAYSPCAEAGYRDLPDYRRGPGFIVTCTGMILVLVSAGVNAFVPVEDEVKVALPAPQRRDVPDLAPAVKYGV